MSTTKILPGTRNIVIKRGDTWDRVYTLQDSDGNPVSLVGATVLVQVRRRPGSTVEISLDTVPAISITGAGNNQILVFYTVDIAAGDYQWDLQVTYSSGKVRTYLSGSFKVVDDIARA